MDFLGIGGWSLWGVIGAFVAAAAVIAWAGTRLVRAADLLADLTGIGEALVGAVLLGAMTSLAGVVTTLAAAAQEHPTLAVGNAIGGIAVQTLFLAVADFFHRKANLEHAAAARPHRDSRALPPTLLILLLLVTVTPEVTVLGVHPGSPLVIAGYGAGLWVARRASTQPMWKPITTGETVADEPEDDLEGHSIARLSLRLAGAGLAVGAAGWLISLTGAELAARTPMSESFVGSLFTAVATSLPELVVSIQAVRQGAPTLAVGNIVGGNSFEVLVVAAADFVYRDGSILHAASRSQAFVIALTALLMGVLQLGLLDRQKSGPGTIGWESAAILVLFGAGYVVLYLMG